MRYLLLLFLPVSVQAQCLTPQRTVYSSLYQVAPGKVKDTEFVRGFNYRLIQFNKVKPGLPLYLPLNDGQGVFLDKYKYRESHGVKLYEWGEKRENEGVIAVMKNSIHGLIHHKGKTYWILTLTDHGDELIVASTSK